MASFLFGVSVALVLAAAPAVANEVCEPSSGPVSLVILSSPTQVYEYARATAHGVPVVAHGPATVVFQDGRVISSDVEAVGRHLNELGWSTRSVNVVASFAAQRARPARRGG